MALIFGAPDRAPTGKVARNRSVDIPLGLADENRIHRGAAVEALEKMFFCRETALKFIGKLFRCGIAPNMVRPDAEFIPSVKELYHAANFSPGGQTL